MLDSSIVLIGMMGSGKTTVGQALAEKLSFPFVDNDSEIERMSGQSAGDLLRADAARFRALESKLIVERLASDEMIVLSTGGGAVMSEATQQALREYHAQVVWLRADADVLLGRVLRNAQSRPMLDGDPERKMHMLLAERDPVYASLARLIIDVHKKSPGRIADEIIGEFL